MAVTKVGLTTNVDVVLAGAPAVNVTFAVLFTEPIVAITVFASALADLMIPVNTPEASVLPDGGAKVLLVPELDSTTA